MNGPLYENGARTGPSLSIINYAINKVLKNSPEEIWVFFQMLTEEQKLLLSKTASRTYHLNITSSQIVHLILDNFECKFCYEQKKYCINGKVTNFHHFPLRMDFDAPETSPGSELFKSYLQKNISLKFDCKLSSRSKKPVHNTLTISNSEFQQMGFKQKLLGPASSVYVTRNQLNLLAGEIHSRLNVFEEYEMPEYQFNQNFVEDFIGLASEQHFQHVPALQALKELSSYGIDIGQDLQPGKI